MESAILLAAGSLLLVGGALDGFPRTRRAAFPLTFLAWLLLLTLVAWHWISLQRPPIRTLGETRLLYAAWLPGIALFARWRWKTGILLFPMALMTTVFLSLNLAYPETLVKALMPALQSAWFVPHVVVYIAAYAALALSSLTAGILLIRQRMGLQDEPELGLLPHRLLWLGFPLLTAGLVVGAFWAKQAWGHYWTWDPKETWALLSWAFYLIPLHQRWHQGRPPSLWLPFLGFPLILICWFGVNALPTAAQSLHSYTD